MRRAGLALAALATLSGCGAATLVAGVDERAAYRPTHTGATFEARIEAADRYLSAYPEGAFAPEVRAYYDRAEPVFYGAKQGSIAGLKEYLRALPEGPHRAQVQTLLLRREAERDRGDLEGAATVTASVDRAGEEREAVRAELGAWLGRFLDAGVWKAPLSEAKRDVIIPWSLSLPMPTCASIPFVASALPALRCAKLLELPYAVVVDGKPDPREATLEIAVIEDAAGRPLEARIGGPELFLRLEETFTVRAIPGGDGERRAAAAARVAGLVRDAFGRSVSSDASCRVEAAAPVFLALACHGVRVSARAGMGGGDDDVIVLSSGE